MPRDIDQPLQDELESTERSEILLCFLTLQAASSPLPLRYVTEEKSGVSFDNGLPIDYMLGGNTYSALPFSFERLSDGDRPPIGKLRVSNIGGIVGGLLIDYAEPLSVNAKLYALSDWNLPVFPGNVRNPQGTPTLVYEAAHMRLKDISGNVSMVEGTLGNYDLTQEPFPFVRLTADRAPDLFRQ